MMPYYLTYLLLLSLVTFAVYGADKRRARRGEWRVPEKTLLGLSLFGGALGGIAAMRCFRHKTRRWTFYFVNAVGLILHAAILVFLLNMA